MEKKLIKNKPFISLTVTTNSPMKGLTEIDVPPDLYVMEGDVFDDLYQNLAQPCSCSGCWIY